jgi:ADP-heptose:LPS heptosyltransferase
MATSRILVIKHGALGDLVLASGRMKYIREMYPHAHITLMTMGLFLPLVRQLGVFDDFIVDNRVSYLNWKDNYKAIKALLDGNFDTIIDIQSSSRTRHRYYPLFRLFTKRKSDWIDAPHHKCTTLNPRCFPLPAKETITTVDIPFPPADLSMIKGEGKHFNELPDNYVLLIPGCSPQHPYKRWPVTSFISLAQRLADRKIHSVVLGTKAESEEIEQIVSSTPKAISFMGKASLEDIPQLAMRALACVGNDTGPTHMSAYTASPVIALFSHKTRNSAIKAPKIHNIISPGLIEEISVDQVWNELLPFIGQA